MLKYRTIIPILFGIFVLSTHALAQNLDPQEVEISLNDALPLATTEARRAFPDLDQYLLYSVRPRVLKNDPKGLFWEVSWQEKDFPHQKFLHVRVYMKDRSLYTERIKRGA